jgi:tRNA A22 N-methylase
VGVLAWYAISNGINGAVFMSAVVVIGGLGGYEVKSIIDKREEKKSSG